MKRKSLTVMFIIAVLPLLATAADEKKLVADKVKDLTVLKVIPDDNVMGSKDAKVVMFEYSSLSCPHCSDFHKQVFPALKKNYIESGKVLYVYRSFPTNRPALAGAKLTGCVPKAEYFAMLSTLFESQSSWAFSENYMTALLNIAKLGDIPEAKFKMCQESKQSEDAILKIAMEATNKLQVTGTPTFFINGEEISGFRPYSVFKEVIEKKIAEKSKS